VTPFRLLALAPFPPRLDATHGGSRAIAELLIRLGERHPIALLALRGADEPPLDDSLKARCDVVREIARPSREAGGFAGDVRVALALTRGTPMWVSRWSVPAFHTAAAELGAAWRPDVVQAEYHVMAQYFAAIPGRPARVLRQLEPGAATAAERGKARRGLGRTIGALDRWAWRRYESSAMRQADVVATLTQRDRATLAPLAGRTPLVVIPLGVPLPERPADPCGRRPETILFVGNFIHPPNVDAAERLIRSVFPLVRRAVPTAELRIVGPDPAGALRAIASAGVTVTGEVPDIREQLEDAGIVIAPLRSGGGMRVKVAEALAAGKAVVATALAAEGLDVRTGRQLVLAETDQDLAEAVVALLRSPGQRAELAGRARAWALSALGWERPVAAFETLYGSLLGDARS
jgi:glycosyltransferase involved in cell wall biosynthesis